MTVLGLKMDFIIEIVKKFWAAVIKFSQETENFHPWFIEGWLNGRPFALDICRYIFMKKLYLNLFYYFQRANWLSNSTLIQAMAMNGDDRRTYFPLKLIAIFSYYISYCNKRNSWIRYIRIITLPYVSATHSYQCLFCNQMIWFSVFAFQQTLENISRPGRNFADDVFKRIFFNENVWISIQIPLNFFLRVQLTIF